MIPSGGFDDRTAIEYHAQHRFFAVFLDGNHAGDSVAFAGAVEDFQADQIVLDDLADGHRAIGCGNRRTERLAGVGLGMGVGIGTLEQLAGLGVAIEMSLRGAGNPISPIEARVEPLRAVRGAHLVEQHVGQLIVKCLGIFGAVEIVMRFTPVPPATGQAMNHLPGGFFGTSNDLASRILFRVAIGVQLRHTSLAEILADHDVGRQLAPVFWNLGIIHLEDDRSIRIGNPAGPLLVLDGGKNILVRLRESTGNLHGVLSWGNK